LNEQKFKSEKIDKDPFIASKHEKRFYSNPNIIQESKKEVSPTPETDLEQQPLRRTTRSASITAALSALELKGENNKTSSINQSPLNDDDKTPKITAASRYGRGFIIRKPEDSPKQRGDLTGQRSWAEVLNTPKNAPHAPNQDVTANIPSSPTSVDNNNSPENQGESSLVQESKSNDNISENDEPATYKSPKL
ncbi:MAG TPA: hypothetical protein VHA13_05995, partial [Gammaproteobacteria bacterium]|nr:hypothetical protein [Gammaproteobacteria bacterium]